MLKLSKFKGISVNQDLFEWLLLLGRWLHITVAITWIGTSIFFMWLDRTLEPNADSKNPGHVGELWMVHGGGFYHVEKMQMGPTKVPEYLHWFKWESYWTWMSGIFLLAMIFYAGSGTFLLDSSVSHVTFWQAVGISFASIVVSWLFYDFVWETTITKTKPIVGHIFTLLWFGGMTYFLCHVLSGRAAYMHIGGMLGTWMTANVFLRIIPRQVKMVEASKRGEAVNQEWGKNAKNRSTHNTYFTLPVIFIMMSNHFPSTYGNKWNWVVLLVMSAAGAAIREYFVVRLKNPSRSKLFGAIGLALILSVILFTRENSSSDTPVANEVAKTSASSSVGNASSGGLGVANGPSGTLKGIVHFTGTLPAREKLKLPLVCAVDGKVDIFANDLLVNDGKVKNVLVRIKTGLEGKTFTDTPDQIAILDQKNCQYEPRIIGVRVGQKVEFLNSDATFHNVRSITNQNENFNVAMPSKDDKVIKTFTKPEIFVQTKCSVHPWMNAYVAVMDHPFFAITGDAGEFEIKNVPVGTYTLEVWHEILGTQTQTITVKSNETLPLDFTYQK
jgi:uncharacterized membrane protein/plastocyanin